MGLDTFMNQAAPAEELRDTRDTYGPVGIATFVEVSLIFVGILVYIWRWQYTLPHAWIPLWGCILLSHIMHRDNLRRLGLTTAGLRSSARSVLPLALVLYLPMLGYGLVRHRFAAIRLTPPALLV